MKRLKLLAEYDCWPVWDISGDDTKDINPRLLNISSELVDLLNEWASDFETTFDDEYPPDSGFSSEEKEKEFLRKGDIIFQLLKEQLSGDTEVIYNRRS